MYDYKYDDQGRPISVTTKSGTTIYGYDATGQLIQVTLPDHRTISYQYDAAGNRIAVNDNGIITKYTTNDLNEYTQVGATQNTYDGDGNLISSTDSTGTTSLRYNLLHQLISVISSQGTWTYQYDALGNRIAVTQNGQQTQYLIDPTGIGNVVGEFDVGGNVTAHYTQGLGLTGRVDASGAAAYYNFDLTGNTTELTGAAGAVLNRYSYLPFGETQSATGTTPNPFVFAGQFGVTQDGNNLFFMRARFYTPATGQFISCDPSGLSGGDVNLRRYGLNNPLENADPSGQIGIPGLLLFWNLQTGPALPPASPTQRAIVEFVEKGRELVKGYTDAKDIAAKAHEKFIEAQNAEAAGGTEVVSGGAEGAAGTAEVTAGTAELEGAGAIGAPEVLLLGGEFVLVYRGTRYVSSKTGLDNAFTNAFLKYIFHNGQTNSAFTPEQCALLKGKLIKLPVKFEDL
jgi:RHS repeat-associated protein